MERHNWVFFGSTLWEHTTPPAAQDRWGAHCLGSVRLGITGVFFGSTRKVGQALVDVSITGFSFGSTHKVGQALVEGEHALERNHKAVCSLYVTLLIRQGH